MPLNAASDRGAVAAEFLGYDLTALAAYPGPIMVIDAKGALKPLNSYGIEFGRALAQPSGRTGFAIILELADTAREKGAAMQEQLSLPTPGEEDDRWVEAIVIPLANGEGLLIGRDVTLDINMRDALIESRQRFKDLVEISADFAWETGTDGTFSYISPEGGLGYSADELYGRRPRSLLLDEASHTSTLAFEASLPMQDEELWVRTAEDNPACILVTAVPLLDSMGRQTGTRGICREITDERLRDEVDAERRMHERVVTYIVESVRNAEHSASMLETAASTVCRAMEGCASEIFQFGDDDRPVKTAEFGRNGIGPHHSFSVIDEMNGESQYQAIVSGRPVIAMSTMARGKRNGVVLVWRRPDSEHWNEDGRLLLDSLREQLGIVLSQVLEQRRLEELSRTDELTGLVNRRAFREEVKARIVSATRRKKPGALMYIDLDNFKPVNDTLGHKQGDNVLKALADILRSKTRETDLIARLGGDEFAVWFDDADGTVAQRRGEQVIEAMGDLAHMSASKDLPLSVSVGIAVFNHESGENGDEIVARADFAMYGAKNHGKARVFIAPAAGSPELDEREQ